MKKGYLDDDVVSVIAKDDNGALGSRDNPASNVNSSRASCAASVRLRVERDVGAIKSAAGWIRLRPPMTRNQRSSSRPATPFG
jgi:hypothetical protein